MQPEESVEIDSRIGCATSGLRNRDRRPHAVIVWLRKRNDDVQPVGRPALKQHHQLLLVRHRRRRHRALQKRRHRAQPNHGDSALLQKISPRKPQPTHALATSMTHIAPLITIAAETPSRSAPIPPQLQNPLASPDHPVSLHPHAYYQPAFPPSPPLTARFLPRETLAPRNPAPLGPRTMRPPQPATKCRCAPRALCCPPAPANNSAGSAA